MDEIVIIEFDCMYVIMEDNNLCFCLLKVIVFQMNFFGELLMQLILIEIENDRVKWVIVLQYLYRIFKKNKEIVKLVSYFNGKVIVLIEWILILEGDFFCLIYQKEFY